MSISYKGCPRLAYLPSTHFTMLVCFLSLVPSIHNDLSCISCRPMSVSAAATALYKSLPWQPAAPCLSSVISPPPGDTHSLWQAFALSVYKSCHVAFLAWTYRDHIWFIDLLSVDVFLVNISFAWKDCLLHFVKKNGTAPCVAVSKQDGPRACFELARGRGLFCAFIGWFETLLSGVKTVWDLRCLPGLHWELLRRYPAVALSSFFTLLTLPRHCWSWLWGKKTTTYQAWFLFGLDHRSISQA